MSKTCPKCGYTTSAEEAAQAAECPRCGVIYARAKSSVSAPQPSIMPDKITETEPVPEEPNKYSPETGNKQKQSLIATLIFGLAIGYFAGREHIKYEMRSAISEAATEFKKNLGSIFGGGSDNKKSEDRKMPVKSPKTFPITASLAKKSWHEGEYGQSQITFTIQFTNATAKNVRAFDGVIVFTDLLDNEIMGANIAINDPVTGGQSFEWDGGIDYNQFMDKHQNLRNAEIQNIKVHFELRKILFEDGEVKEF